MRYYLALSAVLAVGILVASAAVLGHHRKSHQVEPLSPAKLMHSAPHDLPPVQADAF